MGVDIYGKRFDADYEADSKLCDEIGIKEWLKLPPEERPWQASKPGAYYQNSYWSWRALADFIRDHFPDIAPHCEHWQTNDGDGLHEAEAVRLANGLYAMIEDGRAADFIELRDAKLRALPDESCRLCHGTGVRTDAIGDDPPSGGLRHRDRMISEDALDELGEGLHPRRGRKGWCNGCDGRGHSRPDECSYTLTSESVKRFADFCRHSGGFEIH